MDSQLLYQQDVSILDFDAEVLERLTLPDGRSGVILDRSYFYPTGGGQEHDTGRIDSAQVVDVFKDDSRGRLVHVVEGEVSLGPARAQVDPERRLRHMQNHTAQHLLTQCILRQAGYETVSANINGYSPSTLDIVATEIDESDLEQAEHQANQVIYENRPVKTYIVTPEELRSIPLRRPPKVSENIRIVEIDGFDYSPCGGTHVLYTGSIGLVKVLKTERMNDKLRVHFLAGLPAMQTYHQMYETLTHLANKMSIAWQDVPDGVEKQMEQLAALQKELQALRQASTRYEARELIETAEQQGSLQLVKASYDTRPVAELRLLGEELKKRPGLVAYLCSYDGQKVSLVVACGEGISQDARQLLTALLALIGGRGGGDSHLAQGGGVATSEQFRSFLDHIGPT